LVAVDKGVDTIIDDGLLIHQGRILAGRSAKRELTRMAAVRRAILLDPEHAQEMIAALSELKPPAVLVLGTSRNMIDRIVRALGWQGAVIEWIDIAEIATEAEREVARRTRELEGKHVIPAPTMEVKKSFSGYLVDPLRFIFRRKGTQVEVEKSIVRPTYSSWGRFYIADSALSWMVAHAASSVAFVQEVGHVNIQSSPAGIFIELEVTLTALEHLFDVLQHIQDAVREQIEWMTAINVLAVNVTAKRLRVVPQPSRAAYPDQ
jgi:uncharacterized alkaline shock family protein YloU